MLKKIICTLVVAGALTLVGCGEQSDVQIGLEQQFEPPYVPQGVVQNPDPHNINGVWETNFNRLKIDGERFVLTTYSQQWGQSLQIAEGDPGFDVLEVGEIDFDTYYIITGRNVGYDVISVEITNVSQWQTVLERVPVQRRSITIMRVNETGAVAITAPNFSEHFEFYEHEPGFALIEEKGIERNGDIDFDTFYLLTGIEVNETYVYRLRVLDVFTRQVNRNIMGYTRSASIVHNISTQRSGTFILLDDGRKEVIWSDTGNVRVYNFDRTPNTITFAGLRYQRAG